MIWLPRHHPAGALDRAHDPQVGAAAAQIVFQRLADLCVVRLLIAVEQRFCLHDHAVNAISALRCLFFNERLLQRMRLAGIAQPLKSHHLLAGRVRHRVGARADWFAIKCTVHAPHWANPQPKRGPCKPMSLRESVEQRHLRVVSADESRFAIDS